MTMRRGAQVSLAAAITYQVLLLILIRLRPDLDPYWHTLSEWVVGPYGWLMSLGFLISALTRGRGGVSRSGPAALERQQVDVLVDARSLTKNASARNLRTSPLRTRRNTSSRRLPRSLTP
jgi:hypothetical protein